MILYILFTLSAAYVVRVLLFDGTTGPFQDHHKVVVEDGTHEGLVDLWDRVRKVFGVYRIEDAGNGIELWHVNERMDLWKCPKCLSFWITFPASVPFTIITHEYLAFPIIHLSMVFLVQFLVFIQLRIEGD